MYGSRTHLQLRRLKPGERSALAEALQAHLEQHPSVHWARINDELGRIIVEHAETCSSTWIHDKVLELERHLGIHERPLARVFAADDDEPVRRATVELGADLASLTLTELLRRSKHLQLPLDVDLAALLAAIEGVPKIRTFLDQNLGRPASELMLELGKSSVQAILRSELGPIAGLLRHVLALRESRAQQRIWCKREFELCADPAVHLRDAPPRSARPRPLRMGVLERYEQAAIPTSLTTFGAEAVLTLDSQTAASAIFGGLPHTARLGRWAFTSHLVWELAERDVLVLRRPDLEHLDRIDFVLLPEELIDTEDPRIERLATTARRAQRKLRVVGRHPERIGWVRPEERLKTSEPLRETIRHLQRDGSGVLLIGQGNTDAYAAADCSLALSAEGSPWGASLVAAHGWDDAALLIEALVLARAAARQSVQLDLAETATALTLLFGGLDPRTTRRVMMSANVALLFAAGNGIRLARSVRRPPIEARRERVRWHALSPEEVLEHLSASLEGLVEDQIEQRRRRKPKPPSRPRLLARKIAGELENPMTPILAGGASLSALVGSVVDSLLIAGALGLNAGIGGVQNYRAERAVMSLERRERRPARVCRDGRERDISEDELVEGDILLLEAGDVVPADCRILSGTSIEVDESSLTGESQPVRKQVDATPNAQLPDRTCMLYEGSSINVGSVRAIVVATGDRTEAGHAREEGQRGHAPAGVEARLQTLSQLTAPIAGLSALAMTASGLFQRRPPREVVTSAVGLGVASVPEGLPVLATLAQLATAQRLSACGALVRNPRALEALGRMDVLCADKTGTLTEGRIRLQIVSDGEQEQPMRRLKSSHEDILRIALRATPIPNGSPLPHPTDQALVEGSRQQGITRNEVAERRAELPFEPARGLHASVETNGEELLLAVKGAPEVLLPRCTHWRTNGQAVELDPETRERRLAHSEELAAKGYRVLAVAERHVSDGFELDDDNVEKLVLRGFIGYADPVRETAREAISRLKAAGVRVVMITGDHPGTAESIAAELGLLNGHRVVTGAELDELDDSELASRIGDIAVFARVAPLQKVRIVRLLQANGCAVGMTGDGANDAPAIQLADVGIALGESSTSAARAAADLIVSDGHIETILRAVLEGRALWTRVRDAVSILVGGNLGEIAFTVTGGVTEGRSPLNARQLLLVNLLTDTLPALAIAVRPPGPEATEALLSAGPEASLGQELERDMILRGTVTASSAALATHLARRTGAAHDEASTVALLTLTGTQLGQTLVSGGTSAPVIAASLGSLAVLLAAVETPRVSQFFGCRPLGPWRLLQAAAGTALGTGAAFVTSRALQRGEMPWPWPQESRPAGAAVEPQKRP